MSLVAKKICLVGDFAVGKTSLIRRFVDNQFSDRYLSTVGVKISRKLVTILANGSPDSQQLQLLIWDIEGKTKFKAIIPNYLKGAHGVIIAADITRQETVQHISEHLALVTTTIPSPVKIVLALNKSDLCTGEKLAQWKQLPLIKKLSEHPPVIGTYFTSAKTGVYVNDIFQKLAQSLLDTRLNQS